MLGLEGIRVELVKVSFTSTPKAVTKNVHSSYLKIYRGKARQIKAHSLFVSDKEFRIRCYLLD